MRNSFSKPPCISDPLTVTITLFCISSTLLIASSDLTSRDLALYQDTISTFSLPPLNDRFSMLRQLGNLFVVQPEVLKTFMRESYLGRIETHLLRPYLAQRVDYSSFSKRFMEEEGFGVDLDAATTTTTMANSAAPSTPLGAKFGTAMGIGSRGLSRLGGLMKELDQGFSGPTSLTAGGLGLSHTGGGNGNSSSSPHVGTVNAAAAGISGGGDMGGGSSLSRNPTMMGAGGRSTPATGSSTMGGGTLTPSRTAMTSNFFVSP